MNHYKDISWTIPKTESISYEAAQLAVLMDIRDQLKNLNSHLRCQNFVDIPKILRSIKKNTVKKRKVKNVLQRTASGISQGSHN